MEPTTAAAIGTVLGSAAASFIAQLWGNRKTEKVGEKIAGATAAQSTSTDILARVKTLESELAIVKQATVDQNKPIDHRSPKGD